MNMMDKNTPTVRHRIMFSTEKTLAYVSVLELTTIWERSLRRAGIPLRYSQGYNPRPKMNVAAPLPVGCSTEADYLDIWLESGMTSGAIAIALQEKTPIHLHVRDVCPVDLEEPMLSEQLISAEYIVWLEGPPRSVLEEKVSTLMTAESVMLPRRGWKHRGKTYNIRALILDVQLTPERSGDWNSLQMHLLARPGATGRPDEVVKAMNLTGALRRYARTLLHLKTG